MGNQALLLVVVGVVVVTTMGNGRACGAAAEEVHHVAGNDQGWDAASNIAAWSVDRIFRVGDNIWFAYSAAQESVAELRSREEFESCDVADPIKMYNGGLDRVRLDAEGARYFTSGNPGNCRNGLKLHVEVLPQAKANETAAAVEKSEVVVAHQVEAAGPGTSGSPGLIETSMMWIVLALLLCFMGFQRVE